MKKLIAAAGFIVAFAFIVTPLFLTVPTVNAQSGSGGSADQYIPQVTPPSTQGPVTSFDNVLNFIKNILKYTAILFWIAAIFYIFLAAFTYLQAGGDPKKVGEANQRLLYAAVAIAVGLLSYGLPKLIESILTKGTT